MLRPRLGRVADTNARIGNDVMDCLVPTTEIHRQKGEDAQKRLEPKPREGLEK